MRHCATDAPDVEVIDRKPSEPIEPGCYKVAIRENRTQVIIEVVVDNPWDEDSLLLWTSGRMSCDCARNHLFSGDEDDDIPCLTRVRYSALWAELPDGSIIALDEPLVLH